MNNSKKRNEPIHKFRRFSVGSWVSIFCIGLPIILLAVAISQRNFTNQCDMTYNKIMFKRVKTQKSPYYNLIQCKNMENGENLHEMKQPILFISGSLGHFSQVRSLGSLVKTVPDTASALYTLDFKQPLTALHGSLLWDQASMVVEAVETIWSLHETPVTLIGHSYGGLIARAILLLPEYQDKYVRNIITLGTPHLNPPLLLDLSLLKIYTRVNDFWSPSTEHLSENNNSVLEYILLISIDGGTYDTLVPSKLCETDAFSVNTLHISSVELQNVGFGIDHNALLWCKQLINVIIQTINAVTNSHGNTETRLHIARSVMASNRLEENLSATEITILSYINLVAIQVLRLEGFGQLLSAWIFVSILVLGRVLFRGLSHMVPMEILKNGSIDIQSLKIKLPSILHLLMPSEHLNTYPIQSLFDRTKSRIGRISIAACVIIAFFAVNWTAGFNILPLHDELENSTVFIGVIFYFLSIGVIIGIFSLSLCASYIVQRVLNLLPKYLQKRIFFIPNLHILKISMIFAFFGIPAVIQLVFSALKLSQVSNSYFMTLPVQIFFCILFALLISFNLCAFLTLIPTREASVRAYKFFAFLLGFPMIPLEIGKFYICALSIGSGLKNSKGSYGHSSQFDLDVQNTAIDTLLLVPVLIVLYTSIINIPFSMPPPAQLIAELNRNRELGTQIVDEAENMPSQKSHENCTACYHEDGGKLAVFEQVSSKFKSVNRKERINLFGPEFRVVSCRCLSGPYASEFCEFCSCACLKCGGGILKSKNFNGISKYITEQKIMWLSCSGIIGLSGVIFSYCLMPYAYFQILNAPYLGRWVIGFASVCMCLLRISEEICGRA